MMTPKNVLFSIVSAALVVLATGGCVNLEPRPDLTRHYTLGAEWMPADGSGMMSFYVSRPEIPAYLDTTKVGIRSASGEVMLLPFARWAEPIAAGIARAVGESVAGKLETSEVSYYPWPRSRTTGSVLRLEVRRFFGTDDGRFVIDCSWTWTFEKEMDEQGMRQIQGNFASQSYTWDGAEPASLVGAMNAAIDDMAKQVAAAALATSNMDE